MINKIFAWVMIVLNVLMVLYSLNATEQALWLTFVFGSELFISIKYLEGLK